MKRTILSASSAVLIGLVVAVAPAIAAQATNPSVSGLATCNTATGLYDITWTVTGDPAHPAETATIVSQTATTTPNLIGSTVQGTEATQAVQAGLAPGAYTFGVEVQWTNHDTGDLVTATSFAVDATAPCTTVPPPCVKTATYSYAYVAATNSGSVTQVGEDCGDKLEVTATSWKYTTATQWPQVLDVVQYVTVDHPGTFPFAAPVTCGQGDIYASWGAPIVPTATLEASAAWEVFLHSVTPVIPGSTSPTYVVQNPTCATDLTTLPPPGPVGELPTLSLIDPQTKPGDLPTLAVTGPAEQASTLFAGLALLIAGALTTLIARRSTPEQL